MKLSPLQKVKYDLLKKYEMLIAGANPMMKNSMLIAYEKGLNDCFQWVYEYNKNSTAESSNGRITDFGSVDVGSNPASAAKENQR